MARPKKAVRTLDSYFTTQPVKVKAQASEIIIIDSDSDCDNRPKRRRTISNSSGEIEFVEPPPIKRSESDPEIYNEPTVDISFDDDWTMGDDEMVPDLYDDPIDCDDHQQQCPICQKFFTGGISSDFETHVNGCLDSSTAGPSTLNKPKSLSESAARINPKPLRPLTSFQPVPERLPDLRNGNAFSVLMSSHKENDAWKEASEVEDRNFRKTNGSRRKAPFYKILQGMPIAVDAFKYGSIPGVTAYFLTHAHSDHYTNLSSSWKSGPIYCSQGTANLIIHMLKVDPQWVHPLPMDTPSIIPNTGGVSVTLIEANHCPGSCLFLFEGTQTVNAGDSTFKSAYVGSSKHVLHPAVKGKRVDHVYLDTTYLDPKYTFPPQPLVISACADLARKIVNGEPVTGSMSTVNTWGHAKGKQTAKPEKFLVVVGTYSIGKERIVKAIAKALNSKVYCDTRKASILKCQSDPDLHALLTSDPLNASVHVLPLGLITSDKLKEYIDRFKGHFTKAIGFRPTGWTYTPPAGTEQTPSIVNVIARSQKSNFSHLNLRLARNSTSLVQMYPVPYSEHSSFFELTCFAMSLDWGKMIATVNVGSENSRAKMSKWFQRWEADRKKRDKGFVVAHRQADYW